MNNLKFILTFGNTQFVVKTKSVTDGHWLLINDPI